MSSMKIYNKRGLAAGIFWTILAVFNLIYSFISPSSNGEVQVRDIIMGVHAGKP